MVLPPPPHNKIFPRTFGYKKFLTLFQKTGHNGNTQKGKKESIVLVTHGLVITASSSACCCNRLRCCWLISELILWVLIFHLEDSFESQLASVLDTHTQNQTITLTYQVQQKQVMNFSSYVDIKAKRKNIICRKPKATADNQKHNHTECLSCSKSAK